MSRSRSLDWLFLFAILFQPPGFTQAQISPSLPLHDSVIRHPEKLTGLWEMNDGRTIVGLHIELTTSVNGAPRTLDGIEQTFDHANIQVYQRAGRVRAVVDGNWFEDNSAGVEWHGNHLKIRYTGSPIGPDVELDLKFNPDSDEWVGHFRRRTVDQVVDLRRPKPGRGITPSPFIGTWSRSSLMNNCLHIFQEEDGALVGWSDDLQTPGKIRYVNGLKAPDKTREQYGSVALVMSPSSRVISLELKAFTAACCSIPYAGLMTEDGLFIRSGSKAKNDVQALSGEWKRVRGASCISSQP